MDAYKTALKLEPGNAEATEGLARTVDKVQAGAAGDGGVPDEERMARAMADPEIQSILRDPMVNAAIQDVQKDPGALRRVMQDTVVAAKINRLIAAGVLSVR